MVPFRVIPSLTEKQVKHFWSYVAKQPDDGCWLWAGKSLVQGYGTINFGGISYLVHRVSYAISYGIDPAELMVLPSSRTPLARHAS